MAHNKNLEDKCGAASPCWLIGRENEMERHISVGTPEKEIRAYFSIKKYEFDNYLEHSGKRKKYRENSVKRKPNQKASEGRNSLGLESSLQGSLMLTPEHEGGVSENGDYGNVQQESRRGIVGPSVVSNKVYKRFLSLWKRFENFYFPDNRAAWKKMALTAVAAFMSGCCSASLYNGLSKEYVLPKKEIKENLQGNPKENYNKFLEVPSS